MNASKQYQVKDWVTDSKADKEEVAKILEDKPLWKPKHARDLLARRRFIAAGRAQPKTGYWLQHMLDGKRNGRFVMTHVTSEVNTLLDCGDGVKVLKLLRKLQLSVPDIMVGPQCWNSEWVVRW